MMEKYSAQSPSRKKPMSLAFAFSSPAHVIGTFFGSGVIRPASGTWGTLGGWLFYMVLHPRLPLWVWLILIALSLVVGAWACQVTGDDIGVHDHSSIVIDEVFAIWMVLVTVPDHWAWQIGAFCAFRLFDIVKLPPARHFDTHPRWRNGWGVMLDDAVAGAQAILLLLLARLVLPAGWT